MNWIVFLIIACEIGFWVFVISGLIARYVFRMKKLGLFLLAMTPVVDLVLLIASAVDLSRGSEATFAHGLAAVYLGISIAFGKQMIDWADQKFQSKVLKVPVSREELYGIKYAINDFKGWLRHLLAYLIGAGLIGLTVYWVGDLDRTLAMLRILGGWTVVIIIDLLISLSYFIWPKQRKETIKG